MSSRGNKEIKEDLPPGCRFWTEEEDVEVTFHKKNDVLYRYKLDWELYKNGKSVCFILLNPSHADALICDSTLDRCVEYAKKWGFGKMTIVNLFAIKSKDRNTLKNASKPVGEKNDYHILEEANNADLLVYAWGEREFSGLYNRSQEIINMLKGLTPYCIGKTKGGDPLHPSRKSKDLWFQKY